MNLPEKFIGPSLLIDHWFLTAVSYLDDYFGIAKKSHTTYFYLHLNAAFTYSILLIGYLNFLPLNKEYKIKQKYYLL